jgi:regulator of protease activity HflC (stomatin/prohibitin superfamily)
MAEEQTTNMDQTPSYGQLTQSRVPLENAATVFSQRDASGQIPIIIVPEQKLRIRNEYVQIGVIILLASIVVNGFFDIDLLFISLGILVAIALILLGVYRSFYVRIPEGANALLIRGGRYTRTIPGGTHIIPPWILVSHVVTRREIPFNAPIVEAPSKDNIRVNVDTVVTFNITNPYDFVYTISADDFDEVFQAAAQDVLRYMVRQIEAAQVANLRGLDLDELRELLQNYVESYGVEVQRINVTYALPQVDFMQSLESKQLAVIQQQEQEERQALAKRRQRDSEILARQEVIAQVEREREALQLQIQQAEAKKQVIELEAEAEELRLSKLNERLNANPLAARYELEMARLNVASSLAGNSKAILRVGSADDVVSAYMMRDLLEEASQIEEDGQLTEKPIEEEPKKPAPRKRGRPPSKSKSAAAD